MAKNSKMSFSVEGKIPSSKAEKHPRHIIKEEKNSCEVTTVTHKRVRTLADLIEVCEIDTTIWEIERWICNKWEVGSIYRDQELTWEVDTVENDKGHKIKQQFMEGHGIRKPKFVVEPLFQVKAWLKKKIKEIETRELKDEIIKEIKHHAFKYININYNKIKGEYLYEHDLPDIHYGKLGWGQESGEDYDIKIARRDVLDATESLITQCKHYPIEKILFPVGNDYFNVDNKENTTAHGTQQSEDVRWKKTFKLGRQLMVSIIDYLMQIAPVDVYVIPGNHDEERAFYLGDSLECWYHNCPNVKVNNSPKTRKYYPFGKNLIGLTHGYYEKMEKLPSLMPIEVPQLWAESKFREFHIGDKHHKKERHDIITKPQTEEVDGVVVRILSALTASDNWHYQKGYIGSLRSGTGFVFHADKGLAATFHANI